MEQEASEDVEPILQRCRACDTLEVCVACKDCSSTRAVHCPAHLKHPHKVNPGEINVVEAAKTKRTQIAIKPIVNPFFHLDLKTQIAQRELSQQRFESYAKEQVKNSK